MQSLKKQGIWTQAISATCLKRNTVCLRFSTEDRISKRRKYDVGKNKEEISGFSGDTEREKYSICIFTAVSD